MFSVYKYFKLIMLLLESRSAKVESNYLDEIHL